MLDLTRYLAGPACTRLLTELGADVIKIEQPPYGDPNRSNQPRINKRAGAHIQQNRGKRSVCVDINTDEGADIVRALVPHVDIVVENFSPGVMARKGIGVRRPQCHQARDHHGVGLGFRSERPALRAPCFDLIAQGFSGLMHMTGDPEGPPTFVGFGLGDTNVGAHAFGAIGHALFHRERTGRGTHLDVAMVDSLFHFHDMAVHTASMAPDAPEPLRAGRNFSTLSPAGSFRGPEGWIVILCTEWQMKSLWTAMERPDLAETIVSAPTRIGSSIVMR